MRSDPKSSAAATILDDLPFYLARAALSYRRLDDRTLRAVGLESLAPGMATVLHALDEQEGCTVNDLVQRTHLPNGTLSGLLDNLERDRCIQRTPNPSDGRSWRIRLTRKGRQHCVRLQQRHRLVMAMLRDALSTDEAAELKRLLAHVTTRMRTYTATRTRSTSAAKPVRRPAKKASKS